MPRYKFTQESGADFKVVHPDKSDAQEDTNQVRQVLDDLGNLLGHSKRDDSYPKDGTTGGDLAIPESQLNISNIVFCSDYDHPDDAVTAIGANNKTLLVTEAETCDANFTVPANVTVRFERGGKWTINNGITVTFNGQIDAGLWQIFEYVGTGTLAGTPKVKEVYPQWWGALADGSNDDTVAIQDAIDFTRDTVVFPEGTYLVSDDDADERSIELKSNLTLVGVSLKSIIKLKDNTKCNFLYVGSKTGITIKTLSLDGNKASQSAVGANLRDGIFLNVASEIIIKECKITDFNGAGIRTYSTSSNIKIVNNHIENCGTDSITTSGDGIYFKDTSHSLIEGNYIKSSERWGIVLGNADDPSNYNSVIGNNIISDNNNALGCMDLEDGDYNTISGNTFYDSNSSSGHATLTIWGQYNVIDSNIFYAPTCSAISIWDNYNNVSNNIINNSKITSSANTVGTKIDNNKIYNTTIGIFFDSGNEDFSCSGNMIYTTSSYGIRVYKGKKGIVNNNIIDSATTYSIYLQEDYDITCSGNVISNTSGTGYAILVNYCKNVSLSDNIFRNNAGIIVWGTSGNIKASNNNPSDIYSSIPAVGTWNQGIIVWKKNAGVGTSPGWYCYHTGTLGILNGGATTGDTVSGKNILVPNSLTGLHKDDYLDIAGAYGAKYITDMIATLASTTVDASSASGQKVLNVTATTDFAVGETIIINRGTNNEVRVIASIQSGVSLTLTESLTNTYTNEAVENCILMSANATGTVDDVMVSYHNAIFQAMAELGLTSAEGNWTIGIAFGGGTTGITYGTQIGHYIKIGNIVHISGKAILTSKGTDTGSVTITGLPFTSKGGAGSFNPVSLRIDKITFANIIQGYVTQNGTTISLDEVTEAGVMTGIYDTNFANDSSVMVSATYITD